MFFFLIPGETTFGARTFQDTQFRLSGSGAPTGNDSDDSCAGSVPADGVAKLSWCPAAVFFYLKWRIKLLISR